MSLPARILSCLALLALAIGGATAGESEGPFVAVNLKFVQPTGLESAFTIVDPDDDFEPEGAVFGSEISSELSPEIYFGYALGGGRGVAVGYWSFDERGTDRRASPEDGSLWDSLFSPDFSLGAFEGTAEAELAVEAERLDLVYYWRIDRSGREELNWKAGIRHARFQRDLNVVYGDEFDPERVAQHSEAEGVLQSDTADVSWNGVTLGLGARFFRGPYSV